MTNKKQKENVKTNAIELI